MFEGVVETVTGPADQLESGYEGKYMVLDNGDSTALKPFLAGVFAEASDPCCEPTLLGGWCPACERNYFPKPFCCPHCLEEVEQVAIGSRGVLQVFTVVRARPPLGLPQPYGVGYVTLAQNGLLVFCLLDPERLDLLHAGMVMRLVVGPLGCDNEGTRQLRPYFTPDPSEGEDGS